MAGLQIRAATRGIFNPLTAGWHPIFSVLQVAPVLSVTATFRLTVVIHELNLKRAHRGAVRKRVRPHQAAT